MTDLHFVAELASKLSRHASALAWQPRGSGMTPLLETMLIEDFAELAQAANAAGFALAPLDVGVVA